MIAPSLYTPAEVTGLTGLSVHTLRYYESVGLMEPVARASNGHRRYNEIDLRRLNFIMRMRATGMPIEKIQQYVELYRQGAATIAERQALLENHYAELQTQLEDLQDTMAYLRRKIDLYARQRDCMGNIIEE